MRIYSNDFIILKQTNVKSLLGRALSCICVESEMSKEHVREANAIKRLSRLTVKLFEFLIVARMEA